MYKFLVFVVMIATIIFAGLFGHSIALGDDGAVWWFYLMIGFAVVTGFGIFYDE